MLTCRRKPDSERFKTTMENYDTNNRWDAYETSHRRDFVYRTISSTPALRPKTSVKICRTSNTLNAPVGTTVYDEDFCFRPVSKSCRRSATASGHRRNNPHPSRAFMVWRCSASPMRSFDGSSLTEQEVQQALSAQYHSTYRLDYLGLPQGLMKNHTVLAPSNGAHTHHCDTQTEMRHNFRPPVLKAELLGNNSRYGCNKLHGVAVRGIVPTVVQNHLKNQRYCTTYNKYFGSQHAAASSTLTSVQPHMFQPVCKRLASEKEQKEMKTSHTFCPSAHECRVRKAGAFLQAPPTLEMMSAWPGPL